MLDSYQNYIHFHKTSGVEFFQNTFMLSQQSESGVIPSSSFGVIPSSSAFETTEFVANNNSGAIPSKETQYYNALISKLKKTICNCCHQPCTNSKLGWTNSRIDCKFDRRVVILCDNCSKNHKKMDGMRFCCLCVSAPVIESDKKSESLFIPTNSSHSNQHIPSCCKKMKLIREDGKLSCGICDAVLVDANELNKHYMSTHMSRYLVKVKPKFDSNGLDPTQSEDSFGSNYVNQRYHIEETGGLALETENTSQNQEEENKTNDEFALGGITRNRTDVTTNGTVDIASGFFRFFQNLLNSF